jgi:hypothetical protein
MTAPAWSRDRCGLSFRWIAGSGTRTPGTVFSALPSAAELSDSHALKPCCAGFPLQLRGEQPIRKVTCILRIFHSIQNRAFLMQADVADGCNRFKSCFDLQVNKFCDKWLAVGGLMQQPSTQGKELYCTPALAATCSHQRPPPSSLPSVGRLSQSRVAEVSVLALAACFSNSSRSPHTTGAEQAARSQALLGWNAGYSSD